MNEIRIKGLEDLEQGAREFIGLMGTHRVILFEGEMGVGKTTFIGALCRALGVADDISSPTFAIVNEYESATTSEIIYHFDCYRIENDEEALDMGIEDYFDSGRLCLIEWPDRIENFIPSDAMRVEIRELPGGERVIYCGETI